MERRDFIKKTGALVAGMLAEGAVAETRSSSVPLGESGDLSFQQTETGGSAARRLQDARMKDFDDSKFEPVVIPHTNARLPEHSFDDKATNLCQPIAVTSSFSVNEYTDPTGCLSSRARVHHLMPMVTEKHAHQAEIAVQKFCAISLA